jgi:predicted NAD/FAD-binding protein
MRIAIIGAGGSGLASAWMLQSQHEVTVYEKDSWAGGHAHTMAIEHAGQTVYAETGFKFFFEPVYPTFLALLRVLDVQPRSRDATLTVTRNNGREVLVLPMRAVGHYLQLARAPQAALDLLWFSRLLKSAPSFVAQEDWSLTLKQYCDKLEMPEVTQRGFIFPTVAANWGAPPELMPDFPAYSVLKVLARKTLRNPRIFELDRGISQYIEALVERLGRTELRLGAAVTAVTRRDGRFVVEDARGESREFDHIVLATSSRDGAQVLRDVPEAAEWLETISRFTHFDTTIVLHKDTSFMPARRSDWSLINVFHEGKDAWQTEWAGWKQDAPVFRTWMPRSGRMPKEPLHVQKFHHLVVTPENARLQQRIRELQGQAGISLAGMYTTDVDNHESVQMSAVNVARRLAPASPELALWLAEKARA